MAHHHDFGNLAEKLAAAHLEEMGYDILRRNYRYQRAEIDIIAEYDNEIIIVEVKARSTGFFMEPEEAVNRKKIRSIVMAADHFMESENRKQEVRFDIITVVTEENGKYTINHIIDAFQSIDAN